MSGSNLFDGTNLITSKIQPREINYHLVTLDDLNAIRSSSFLSDFFTLASSLLWGAYSSFFIANKVTPPNPPQGLPNIDVYQSVLLYASLVCTAVTLVFYWYKYTKVSDLTKHKSTTK